MWPKWCGKGRAAYLAGGEDFAAVEGDATVNDVQVAVRHDLPGHEDERHELRAFE